MSPKLKWILVAAGVLILLFVIVKFTNKNKDATKVTAGVVKRCTIVETVNASGKIYPELEVKLGTGIAGEVTELYVKEGDTVRKGQVLAKIATEGSRVPKLNMNDYSTLLQGIQSARAGSTRHITITAPVRGVVSMLNVKKGERVGGMQLSSNEFMRIADFSSMELRVDVNENDIIKVRNGDSADIEVEAYSKRRFKGVVRSIANNTSKKDAATSFLSNDATTYEVRIPIDPSSYRDLINSGAANSPFRSGMNARAEIKTQIKTDVLCVPAAAVASRAKGSGVSIEERKKNRTKGDDEDSTFSNADDLEEVVFVIDGEGRVSKRVVTTGIQDVNHLEIVSGVKEGEKIVAGPYSAVSRTLRNGNKVIVVSKDELFEK